MCVHLKQPCKEGTVDRLPDRRLRGHEPWGCTPPAKARPCPGGRGEGEGTCPPAAAAAAAQPGRPTGGPSCSLAGRGRPRPAAGGDMFRTEPSWGQAERLTSGYASPAQRQKGHSVQRASATERRGTASRSHTQSPRDPAIPPPGMHPKNRKPGLKPMLLHPCSWQLHSQQPRRGSAPRPSADGWTDTRRPIHTAEYPSALERKDVVLPAPTGTDLGGVVLSERSQSLEDKDYQVPRSPNP